MFSFFFSQLGLGQLNAEELAQTYFTSKHQVANRDPATYERHKCANALNQVTRVNENL